MCTKVRGIRGAITVEENTKEAILEGTTELLKEMLETNNVPKEEICSIFFSMTSDLDQEFPAKSARELDLLYTPLLCMKELPVKSVISKCIRVLIHFNTKQLQKDIRHIYLRDAKKLRPDLNN